MPSREKPFSHIVIASHPQIPDGILWAEKIASYLEATGRQVSYGFLYGDVVQSSVRNRAVDLLIALGGDGTMLRAGHLCAPHQVPILGINLGRFGFLTEIKHDQWEAALPKLLSNDVWLESRMMLRADHIRGEDTLGR